MEIELSDGSSQWGQDERNFLDYHLVQTDQLCVPIWVFSVSLPLALPLSALVVEGWALIRANGCCRASNLKFLSVLIGGHDLVDSAKGKQIRRILATQHVYDWLDWR